MGENFKESGKDQRCFRANQWTNWNVIPRRRFGWSGQTRLEFLFEHHQVHLRMAQCVIFGFDIQGVSWAILVHSGGYPFCTLRIPMAYPRGTGEVPSTKVPPSSPFSPLAFLQPHSPLPPLPLSRADTPPPGTPLGGNRMPSHPAKDWAHPLWIQSSLWRSCVYNDFTQSASFQFIAALISNKSEWHHSKQTGSSLYYTH